MLVIRWQHIGGYNSFYNNILCPIFHHADNTATLMDDDTIVVKQSIFANEIVRILTSDWDYQISQRNVSQSPPLCDFFL